MFSTFKSALIFSFFHFFTFTASAQLFAWVKGSSTTNQAGVYGQLGVANINNVPGARSNGYTWSDVSGNFWLYGGFGYDKFGNYGNLADLWKYIPGSNTWVWMKGDSMCNKSPIYGTQNIAAPNNTPGSRYLGVRWRDAAGNLWLYGSVNQSDLWKFNIATNNWTWMGGSTGLFQSPVYSTLGVPSSTISPGNRYSAGYCSDANGDLWLHGGTAHNDLWKYSVATGLWTWVNGSQNTFVNSVFGTLGSPTSLTLPGGREASCLWADAGNIWLFGGNGMDAVNTSSQVVFLNDTWKYSISSGQWTWMKGNTIGNQNAIQGVPQIFASNNEPGGRVWSVQWKDSQGKFWLFGGMGFMANSAGYLSDIWQYDPTINQWAWMLGAPQAAQNGQYGTIGVPSATNFPGGRFETEGWMDSNDDVWVFGGYGYPQNGSSNTLNDLWKYTNCSVLNFSVNSSSDSICAGASATLSAYGAASYSWSTSQLTSTIVVNPTITATYTVEANFLNSCTVNKSINLKVNQNPTITIVPTTTNLCLGEALGMALSGAQSYSYNGATFTNSSTVLPQNSGNLVISGTDLHGCISQSTVPLVVNACTGFEANSSSNLNCSVSPNPNTGQFYLETNKPVDVTLMSLDGKIIEQMNSSAGKSEINFQGIANGLYILKISNLEMCKVFRLRIENE